MKGTPLTEDSCPPVKLKVFHSAVNFRKDDWWRASRDSPVRMKWLSAYLPSVMSVVVQ